MTAPEYATHIRIAALGIAGRGVIGDREREAIERAIVLKGGIVDGDLCSASEFKIVIDDVLQRVLELYSERLVPAVRAEFSDEVASAIEKELGDSVRTILTDIADTFGTKH
jgi:hypothetical protein